MEASLKALGVDAIGLYQFHRPDPKLPYAESIGAVKELLDEGKIRLAGISNATIDQIDIARKILGEQNLASVQNQLSPAFRSSEDELAHCAELGIAFLPYSPLGGISRAGDLGSRHAAFGQVADAHGVSPQQVALAWLLAKARWSSRSPAPAAPSPSPTPPRPPTSPSPPPNWPSLTSPDKPPLTPWAVAVPSGAVTIHDDTRCRTSSRRGPRERAGRLGRPEQH